MKTTFAVIAWLLALSFTEADHFNAFEDGKRYVYEYKTRVATGIAEDVKQFSGFGFVGRVTAQSVGDNVVYQITDLKLGYFNEKMDHIYDEMHIDYQRISDNREGHINNLEKPFWVEYDHGTIKSIYFTQGEDVAKHNNKKALASLFQLYLERNATPDLHVYSREEDGIGGLCDTSYVIGQYQNQQKHDDVLNVTKHRNYENCTNRPHLIYSSFMGQKYNMHDDNKPLASAATIRYFLKGTREHYTIEEIHATGAIDLTPFTNDGRSIISIVNQTLHLLKIEDAEPPVKPDNLVKETTLYYEFENDRRDYKNVDLKQSHYFNRVYPFTDSSHVEKADALYVELEEEVKKPDGKLEELIPKFYDALVEFNYDDFDHFYMKHLNQKSAPSAAGAFLLKLLPIIGTNPAILYSFNIIEKDLVPVHLASEILKIMPFNIKEPSQKIIEVAKEFGSKAIISENFLLHVVSRLAYGTLLYKACHANIFNPHPHDSKHYVSDEKCAEYIQELVDKFHSVPEEQRSLYLRTVANTRSVTGAKLFLSVLKGNYDSILKEIAIWAPLHIHDVSVKEEINAAITSIYNDPEEDYILRGFAFEYLMFTIPSPQFFSSVLLVLEKDPSERLKSYIYAALNNYANTTHVPLATYIKLTLKYVEKRQTDFVRNPIHHAYTYYNNKYNFGGMSYIVSVPSHESVFPRAFFYDENFSLFGYSVDYMSFGFASLGQLFDDRYMSYGAKLSNNHESQNEFINKTAEKCKLKRFSGRHNKYEVYVKKFLHDVFISDDILSAALAQYYPNVETDDGRKVKILYHTFDYTDFELLLPNELGMPVSFRGRAPFVTQIHFREEHPAEKETVFKLDFRAGLSIESQVAVLSVLYGPIGFKLTTKSAFHLPVHVDLNPGQKADISLLQLNEPFDVFYIKSLPKTIGKTDLEIHYSSKPVQKKFSTNHDYLGVGLTFNLTYDSGVEDRRQPLKFLKAAVDKTNDYKTPYYHSDQIYTAVNNFFGYYIYNPTATPYALNIQYSPAAENPTTAFTFDFESNNFKKMDEEPRYNENTYKVKIVGKGSVERQWDVEYKTKKSWPYEDGQSVTFQFKRSALSGYDSEPFEVCYSSNAAFTDFKKIFSFEPSNFIWMYNADIFKGKDCTPPRLVNIKAIASSSEEQEKHNYKNDPEYIKCQKLTEKGFPSNKHCWNHIDDLARLDQLNIDIDYGDISIKAKETLYKFYETFRHKFYDYLYVDHFHGSREDNHVSIVANISYLHPEILDLHITRPDHTVYYNNINIRKFFPQWDPITMRSPIKKTFAKMMFNYHTPFCVVSDKYVKTFDDVAYKAPLSTKNYHLAFTDTENAFIFFRSVEGGKYGKAVRFYFNGEMVEIAPKDDKLIVTVNGEPKMTEGEKVYFHKVNDKDILVVNEFYDWIRIAAHHTTLAVFYDGYSGFIVASNLYQQSQHGLCGNFDNEKHNEFEGPDGKIYNEPADFVHSYEVEN